MIMMRQRSAQTTISMKFSLEGKYIKLYRTKEKEKIKNPSLFLYPLI